MKREKMKNKEKPVLHLRAGRETAGACFRRFVGEDQGSNDDISDNQWYVCVPPLLARRQTRPNSFLRLSSFFIKTISSDIGLASSTPSWPPTRNASAPRAGKSQ